MHLYALVYDQIQIDTNQKYSVCYFYEFCFFPLRTWKRYQAVKRYNKLRLLIDLLKAFDLCGAV